MESRVIQAGAVSEAESIRGQGDASALESYAQAYEADTDFFSCWRSLQALEKSLTENTALVPDRNHSLWKDLLTYATSQG